MITTNLENLQNDIEKYFNTVVNDSEIVIAAQADGIGVVIMPFEEYNKMTLNAGRVIDPSHKCKHNPKGKDRKAGKFPAFFMPGVRCRFCREYLQNLRHSQP